MTPPPQQQQIPLPPAKSREDAREEGKVEQPPRPTSESQHHRDDFENEEQDTGDLLDLFRGKEKSEEALIEERRRKRAAILERHRQRATLPAEAQKEQPKTTTHPIDNNKNNNKYNNNNMRSESREKELVPSSQTYPPRIPPSKTDNLVTDKLTNRVPGLSTAPFPGGSAAASTQAVQGTSIAGEQSKRADTQQLESNKGAVSASAGAEEDVEDDMFAEDDDMFAEDEQQRLAGPANAEPEAIRGKGLADDWDDEEGYYNFRVGEVLCGKYEVYSNCGQGVFSTVLRARDVGWNKAGAGASPAREYAVKVVRANDVMRKAAEQEVNILKKLAGADPEGKKHCIYLLDTFEYRNHVCMVFEAMNMNLREVVKKFGRGVGINLAAVRTYAFQLLLALKLLRTCGVLHADIKPDNILVNSSNSSVKLCDLGSAMYAGDNELTPYLVSRFYRSPEVILGLPYSYAMDMWSLGCVIFELFTGKIAFPGKSNNEMLKLMMDTKGPFPKKMLRRGSFVEKHFDNDVHMTFFLVETDPVTKKPVRTAINHPKIVRELKKELEKKAGQTTDRKKLHQLADFLEQTFLLDPDRRITVNNALSHPFIKETP